MALLHFAMSATVDYEQHHLASVPCQMLTIILIILINFIIIVILVRRASFIRRQPDVSCSRRRSHVMDI